MIFDRLKRIEERESGRAARENARLNALASTIKDAKSKNKNLYSDLMKKHAEPERTFEALAAKRRKEKIEKDMERYGKYG